MQDTTSRNKVKAEPKKVSIADASVDHSFHHYVRIILIRKWIILTCIIICFGASFYYVKRIPSIYESQIYIVRESETEGLPNIIGLPVRMDFFDKSEELLLKSRASLSEIKQKLSEEYNFDVAIDQLKNRISLFAEKTSENVVRLSATATIPAQAQAIANIAAAVYVKQKTEIKKSELNQGVEFLKEQLSIAEKKVQDTEKAVNDFREREGLIFTASADLSTGLLGRLGDMQSEFIQAENDTELLKSQLQTIEKLIDEKKKAAKSSMATGLSLQMDRIRERLVSLQLELNTKLETLTEKDPEVIATQRKIDAAQKQLRTEFDNLLSGPGTASLDPVAELQSLMEQYIGLNVQLKGSERKVSLLKERIEKFKFEHPELVSKQIELVRMERQSRVYEQAYTELTTKYQDILLLQQMKGGGLRVVDEAALPRTRITSKTEVRLITGALMGLVLGIMLALFMEYLENAIKTPDDVEQYLGLSVLGIVPRITDLKKKGTPIIVATSRTKSPPAEAYRSLRTSLFSSKMNTDMKMFMVTSAGPKEGKSLTIANLGAVLAQAGQNVLLVDADLRRPTVHRIFNMDRHKGLTTVLSGELPLEEAVAKTEIPNLNILPSGSLPSNPSELLGSEQMVNFISLLREKYDIVLFDSAPILGMTDAAVLSSELDGVLFVIKTGDATRKALKMALTHLEQVDARVLGVVLNDVDVKRDRYYSYYYYYYYSTYEDGEGKTLKKKRRHSR